MPICSPFPKLEAGREPETKHFIGVTLTSESPILSNPGMQYAHFSVTLRLLFKLVIQSFVYCKILLFFLFRHAAARANE